MLQVVARMYTVMTPHLRGKWTPRTQQELKVNTTLLDMMTSGKGPEASDIIAQRIKALEKSVADGNYGGAEPDTWNWWRRRTQS